MEGLGRAWELAARPFAASHRPWGGPEGARPSQLYGGIFAASRGDKL